MSTHTQIRGKNRRKRRRHNQKSPIKSHRCCPLKALCGEIEATSMPLVAIY
jgi:hypothetical protein